LLYGRFSSKSDVFSFGVVLWEIFSYGQIPYPELSNKQAKDQVVSGVVLSKPDDCPDEIYNLMKKCWKKDPNERPNFFELQTTLANKEISSETPQYNELEPKQHQLPSDTYDTNQQIPANSYDGEAQPESQYN